MLDGAALPLSGTTSLPPRMGRGLIVSLLMACWAAMLSCSLVVYQTTSFGAQKGSDCCVLRMPLVDTFCPGPSLRTMAVSLLVAESVLAQVSRVAFRLRTHVPLI
jgi:hypothetical protein